MLFYDVHTHKKPNNSCIAIQNLILSPSDYPKLEKHSLYSLGYHPWFCDTTITKDSWEQFSDVLLSETVCAIGEIGLDKTKKTTFDLQKSIFLYQIKLSELHQKPVIIHCVKAYSDLLEIHKKQTISQYWIYHNFNSSFKIAEQLIAHKGILSFGKLLFNKRSKAYTLFKDIKKDTFLLETDDSSYSIQEIYQQAAFIKGIDIEDIAQSVEHTFQHIFSPCFKIIL